MRISVVLATFNGSRFLREQLDSLVSQSVTIDELIVVDDASTDDTSFIAQQFRSHFKDFVFYKNSENQGFSKTFGTAAKFCSGGVVFFCDQDDVWAENKIQRHLEVYNGNPKILSIINDAVLTDSSMRESGLTKLQQIEAGGASIDKHMMGCCVSVKRELLDLLLPIPHRFPSHDGWIGRIASEIGVRMVLRESLQKYRRHENNTSVIRANNLAPNKRYLTWFDWFRVRFGRDAKHKVYILPMLENMMVRRAYMKRNYEYILDVEHLAMLEDTLVKKIAYQKERLRLLKQSRKLFLTQLARLWVSHRPLSKIHHILEDFWFGLIRWR